jgi:hypothetical protein
MSSNQVFSSIPIFDSSNYRRWADKMKSYLQMYNMWGVTIGTEKEPTKPLAYRTGSGDMAQVYQPTVEQLAQYERDLRSWNRDNEAAVGAMTLKMRDDLSTHRKDSAAETWKHLEDMFGKDSQAQIYQWWKELSHWKFPGKEAPGKEFGRWDLLVDKLTKAEQTVPHLSKLSSSWKTFPPPTLTFSPCSWAACMKTS